MYWLADYSHLLARCAYTFSIRGGEDYPPVVAVQGIAGDRNMGMLLRFFNAVPDPSTAGDRFEKYTLQRTRFRVDFFVERAEGVTVQQETHWLNDQC